MIILSAARATDERIGFADKMAVDGRIKEGESKPKTYALRPTDADGSTTAKKGLIFRHPAFQLCTWCGFVGLDTKPAMCYVDDLPLE